MGNFHSLHVTSERDPSSKILHVKTFETMDNVHNKLYLLQYATIQKHFSWIKISLAITNQIIWGIPAAEYIPTYSSSTAYNKVGTDNLHSTQCSMW